MPSPSPQRDIIPLILVILSVSLPCAFAADEIMGSAHGNRVGPTEIRIGQYRGDPVATLSKTIQQTDHQRLRLVQFSGRIRDGWRTTIENLGIQVLAYVPNNTYLVWTGTQIPNAAASLEDLPFVRWQGPVPPVATHGRDLVGRAGMTDVMLLYALGSGEVDIEEQVASVGGSINRVFPAQPDGRLWVAVAHVPAENIPALGSTDPVIWIEPAPKAPVLAGEMSSVVTSGQLDTGVPVPGYGQWLDDLGFDGSGVLWAVVDSGVDPLHPDLAGLEGISYPGCDTDLPGDDPGFAGHGTPVASIVLGTAAGGYADPDGFLWGLGVAPGARLLSQNAICDGDVEWPPVGGWQILSRDGILAGAVGSNNSWNSQEGVAHGYQISERVHDLMVRDGNFDTPDISEPYIMVFNAGNQGPDPSTIPAPKEAKNLITVGAIDNWRVSGNFHTVIDFSSRGPTSDGRIFPNVVAPGRGVGAAAHRLGGFYGPIYEIPNTDGLYMSFEGTSAAAPHISGMLAVISEWWRRNGRLHDPSPAMARAMLVNGTAALEEGPAPPNFDSGWGRADLGNVLQPGVSLALLDQEHVLTGTDDEWSLEVEVDDPAQPLRVTVAWTDAAAAAGADPALVNDLDLQVDTLDTPFLGNQTDGGWSVPGGQADRLNNLEEVHVQEPGPNAVITIRAFHIPGDGVPYNGDSTDQDFAVACRNCRLPLPAPRRPNGRTTP